MNWVPVSASVLFANNPPPLVVAVLLWNSPLVSWTASFTYAPPPWVAVLLRSCRFVVIATALLHSLA